MEFRVVLLIPTAKYTGTVHTGYKIASHFGVLRHGPFDILGGGGAGT